MRSKSIVLLALGMGCGLVASIGISQFIESANKVQPDAGERQPIFIALTDIAPHEELTAQNIKLEEWPKNIVPQGALTKLEEVEGKRSRMKSMPASQSCRTSWRARATRSARRKTFRRAIAWLT